MSMSKFLNNILELGLGGIVLYFFTLLIIHQVLAWLLAEIEKWLGYPVQFYWYDIPITLFFIFLFVYGIYQYRG